ncbi:MAG TPA: hypothetical protein VN634_10705 [Candidatus Limnocylindrales bacterium]|nr:hypothetical protein [Candidatus Limnocylindrales bacterium]
MGFHSGSRDATAKAAFLAAVLALSALALWMVWPAFRPGRIINLDAPRHLLRAFVMTNQFLPSGHVDGLSPWWYLGAQLFLFQSYGYFFLIGITSIVLSGWAHVATLHQIFKFYYVLPILLLPGVTALLARRLGIARRGAAAAALASLIFTSPLGYGVQGMFGIGLLLQGAGVVCFALAWPEFLAVLVDRSRAPWRAVLMVAAVVICHFISGAYTLGAAGLAAAWLALTTRSLRPLMRYALVTSLVLLIAGHSLFPSVELHSMSGQGVGWGTERDRFWRLLAGTLFGARELALPAIAAAAWAVFRGNRMLSISAMLFFTTALAGGANEQPWMPAPLESIIQLLLRPRALPYAALLQAVFAGLAADRVLAVIESAAAKYVDLPRYRWWALAAPAVFAVMLLAGRDELNYQRRFVKTESELSRRDHTVYLKLVEWLRSNVHPPAIVAVPRTLLPQSAVGARSVISFLNLDTGLYTFQGDQAELTRASRHSGRVDLDRLDKGLSRNAGILRAAGVSYVILSDRDLRQRLADVPELEQVFEYDQSSHRRGSTKHGRRHDDRHVRRHGTRQDHEDDEDEKSVGVAVYRLRGGGEWLRGPGLHAESLEKLPEHLSWNVTVEGTSGVRPATAALNWHPNWTARVDGVATRTRMTPSRRVQFDIPAGKSRVTLDFVRTTREKVWNALSLATFVAVLVLWWRDTRARRGRTATASLPEEMS